MTPEELHLRGWDSLDILLITGDAYIDHPAVHVALIGRLLESHGFKVGVIAQPDWKNLSDFSRLGRPRLAVYVTGGQNEPLITHFLAKDKPLLPDAWSPGGSPVKRPARAVMTYAQRARQAFPGLPVIIGGVEASLRRLAYFDPWNNAVRRSILFDAKADLLIYTPGEFEMLAVAQRLAQGEPIEKITNLPGTTVKRRRLPSRGPVRELFSYDEVKTDKLKYLEAFSDQAVQRAPGAGFPVAQLTGDRYVVVNPPPARTTAELDLLYALPFTRLPHPSYGEREKIAVAEALRFAIVSHRGCVCGASFCQHEPYQGSQIQSRSEQSILDEAVSFASDPAFQGMISDLSGPYANHYGSDFISGNGQNQSRTVFAEQGGSDGDGNGGGSTAALTDLRAAEMPFGAQQAFTLLLQRLQKLPGINRVLLTSPLRLEWAAADPDFLNQVATHHVQNHCRIMPGHVTKAVNRLMRRPGVEMLDKFLALFLDLSQKAKKEQFIQAHFIINHPGCRTFDMVELAAYSRKRRLTLNWFWDFSPVPLTASGVMAYTALDPETRQPLYVPREAKDRLIQKALVRYLDPGSHYLVKKALYACNRADLIGSSSLCLISPKPKPRVMRKPVQARPDTHLPPRPAGTNRLDAFRHRSY